MPEAEQRSNEAARLLAVRALRLLDTAPEERFDVFTRLAASVCGTPAATVSLVDEHRVWFKSTQGLPAEVREVPRDIAACAHVVLSPDQIMVVPDASKDPRLSSSPLVTGPTHMRFYAGAPLLGPNGEAVGTLCVFDTVARDPHPAMIEALGNLAQGVCTALRLHELRETVLQDPVTGLGNRRLLDEAIGTAVAEARGTGRAVGLIALDLDRFKAVNDLLGHQAGDSLLREVARRIRSELRTTDVAVRLGSDEFAVLLPQLHADRAGEATAALAERISQSLRTPPLMVHEQRLGTTASIGCAAVLPGAYVGTDTVDWLVRAADLALYNSKKGPRGKVSLYDESLHRGVGSKRTLAADLRHCLAEDGAGLSLVLQPICRTSDRAIEAYESLLRWAHPMHGPISPGDFVPVAERSGQASALDGWVLKQACTLLANAGRPDLVVTVNVSPWFAASGDLLEAVRRVLGETGVPPAALVIEMTERMFLDDVSGAAAAAEELRAMGMGVALDDFGAGHASFAYLRDIPFSKIKLDRALTIGLDAATADARRGNAILHGVVAMSHAIGATVVAEGVETEAQFQALRAAGCDAMQGWLLGRPLPAEAWLAEPVA
jgi:diguanylate cyclase (GGDEF)-like protein